MQKMTETEFSEIQAKINDESVTEVYGMEGESLKSLRNTFGKLTYAEYSAVVDGFIRKEQAAEHRSYLVRLAIIPIEFGLILFSNPYTWMAWVAGLFLLRAVVYSYIGLQAAKMLNVEVKTDAASWVRSGLALYASIHVANPYLIVISALAVIMCATAELPRILKR